jgi:thymidylate synthase (FAD)
LLLKFLDTEVLHTKSFSQRYADTTLLADDIPLFELRRQDNKNRQNSIDDISDEIKAKWGMKIREHFAKSKSIYDGMIADGIAKDVLDLYCRWLLPTRLYMSGSVRSWVHYINLRSSHGTQKEHMMIANDAKIIFIQQFPTISEALGWVKNVT